MGLLQRAAETYDRHAKYIGEYEENKTPLAPISHITTKADIVVTLDSDGSFIGAEKRDKNAPKVIIPVTENSAGRTSGISAHPLCDQLVYISGCDEEKYIAYIDQLEKWCESEYAHPKLLPILKYVKSGSIISDLLNTGCVKLDEKGNLADVKLLVIWRIIGIDDGNPEECWLDKSLFDAFIGYYREKNADQHSSLCIISGSNTYISEQHPKGAVPYFGNAKLISSNDDKNFTYLGRFTNADQVAEVGYEVSQKAHNALRWLVANQGVREGKRVFVCWNPEGRKVQSTTGAFMSLSRPVTKPTEYKAQLKKTLDGYRTELPDNAGVIIASFDAASDGRLAVTYYNELTGSDFLQRLYHWDDTCCWYNCKFGIQSPPLYQIVNCAYGTLQSSGSKAAFKTDDEQMSRQIERLVASRINQAALPHDFVRNVSERAALANLCESKNRQLREDVLFVACALIRKYKYDKYGEEVGMSLDKNSSDRSYQFGRLLAVYEKAERDTYSKDEEREPNAIRFQAAFCRRPLFIAAQIEKQLESAYFPRLNPASRAFYKRLIGEIMAKINESSEDELNLPLAETYLIGYYLQRNDLYTSKK